MTEELNIRKLYTVMDEVLTEGERILETPIKRAVAIAVIKNPFAGRYQEDLSILSNYGEPLGELLSANALKGLGISDGSEVESYGKAVIVGLKGEIEHGHAIIHPKIGAPFRSAIGGADKARAVIPSTGKIGAPGTSIDVPVHYKDSEWVVTHADTITVMVPDAPFEDEILVALAVTTGGRPHARVPGLQKEAVL
ncbi:amino acid synthesis family protein [Siminovitchia sediminis]|uniref:Amino acid synthesis family protein n=1 Tax=Siminovitchia sediminis TaxID=1274353 RepID=A0ABW4KJF8_9BACI